MTLPRVLLGRTQWNFRRLKTALLRWKKFPEKQRGRMKMVLLRECGLTQPATLRPWARARSQDSPRWAVACFVRRKSAGAREQLRCRAEPTHFISGKFSSQG